MEYKPDGLAFNAAVMWFWAIGLGQKESAGLPVVSSIDVAETTSPKQCRFTGGAPPPVWI